MKTSEYSGFYKLSVNERLNEVKEFSNLSDDDVSVISKASSLDEVTADHMIENVIGYFPMPMGVALNFIVNGKDVIIPMVSEEPSVVAAASNAAKLARKTGGFTSSNTGSIMIAQIQFINIPNPECARLKILENKQKIIELCNSMDPVLVKHGGGAVDVEVRILDSNIGKMLVVHLLVNTLDAMGANTVNTMAEGVSPFIEELTSGTSQLRILSNLSIYRLARSYVTISKEDLGGEQVVDKIIDAYQFAEADPFRAVTHNKGIMNGISAAVLATGNDTRAIESGAHAYAAITGTYKPLTVWEKNPNGDLTGSIELPLSLGLVGGATKIHPTAGKAVKILGVDNVSELENIIAALGLAQNFAAIRALATEGIQRGHMGLHARNIATTVGATGEELERIVKTMIANKKINTEYAKELMNK